MSNSVNFSNPYPIENLPATWQVRSIEFICERVTSGGTPSRRRPEFYKNGTINWFKTKELNDWYLDGSEEKITQEAVAKSSAKIFPANTVLMAMYGDGDTITSLGILRNEAATNQACCAMIVNPKICDHQYLLYALKYHRNSFIQIATGGAQRNLNGKLIRNFAVQLPPLPIQRRIAAILGRLDDKIEVNRHINRTLEAMAQALYRHWFVDFGPFQERGLVESALGLIPAGWRVGRLDEVAEIIMGASPDGSTYNQEGRGIPLINGPVEFGEYFATKSKWTTAPTRLSKAQDLILCVRGSTTGRRVIADDVYCLGRGVCAIRAYHGHQKFVDLTVDRQLEGLLANTTGSVFPSLSSADIRGFQVVIPPAEIVEKFTKLVDPMEAQRQANVRTSGKLAEIRDYLLPKLLAGEIGVATAEEEVASTIGEACTVP